MTAVVFDHLGQTVGQGGMRRPWIVTLQGHFLRNLGTIGDSSNGSVNQKGMFRGDLFSGPSNGMYESLLLSLWFFILAYNMRFFPSYIWK